MYKSKHENSSLCGAMLDQIFFEMLINIGILKFTALLGSVFLTGLYMPKVKTNRDSICYH